MRTNEQQVVNKDIWEEAYIKQTSFLRYPGDWIPRFHNMYLKEHQPTGRVLDFGCGSANNGIFFIRSGYDVYGVDITDSVHELISLNLEFYGLDPSYHEKFQDIPLDWTKLPYEDNYFDIIISNQVLYYLSSEAEIKRVCKELSRCLKPGGTVFFTTMGPKNYYMAEHTKEIHDGKVHEVRFEDPSHRLYGLREMIYLVENEDELKALFSDFECITTGYFDQRMFDVTSNFHWIFAGKKK